MKNIVDGFIHCLMNLTEAMNITVDVVEKAIKELDIIKNNIETIPQLLGQRFRALPNKKLLKINKIPNTYHIHLN